jgi:site-specific recombinase XerD
LTDAAARRQAGEHLRALLRDLDKNRPPDPERDRTTLAAWAPQWQELKKPELTAGSRARYANLLEHHILPYLGAMRLDALRPGHVLWWRERLLTEDGPRGRPRPPVEVRAAETLLRAMLRDAAAHEHTVSEAIAKMRHLKAQHSKPPAFTGAQFLRLLEAAAADPAGEPWRTMYVVAFYAMARDSEVRGLDWRHVLWATRQIDVAQQYARVADPERGPMPEPKKGSVGLVDVPREAIAVLEAHRRRAEAALDRPVGPDEPVFAFQGRRIRYEKARRMLKRHLRLAELPDDLGWHSFRRGGATAHAAAAVDPLTLRQLLRHADLDTTMGYLRPVARGGRQAAERAARRVRATTAPGPAP